MNVFFEFYKIVQSLQHKKVKYALIGGVAMAYHAYARFTKDIDILLKEDQLPTVKAILEKEGYHDSKTPWTFKDSNMTLNRFWKIEDGDEMYIDVLVSNDPKHDNVIENADISESDTVGIVMVARKEDLIWLKKARNSEQDQLDIKKLQDETDR